jgi:hypothetical protein
LLPLNAMKLHGWFGLAILIGAEVLLYAGVRFVATWFTPIMWSGYILLVDALIARRSGRSWLTTRQREFGFLAVLSVLSWLIFETYNLKLKNWAYVGVPEVQWQFDLGLFWSFATITPALFQTAEFLETYLSPASALPPGARNHTARTPTGPMPLTLISLCGLAFVIIPPLLPDWLAPYTFGFVWIGFIGLLEPINYGLGLPSMFREWRESRGRRIGFWLGGGLACGFIWESWNAQALAQGGAGWLYTMPALIHNLVFGWHYGKMPAAGLLGFPPFALECFALYYFLKSALQLDRWLPPAAPVEALVPQDAVRARG